MSFSDNFTYLISGFGIVMLTLLSLAVVCWLVGILFRRFPQLAQAGRQASPVGKKEPSALSASDPQLIAVIGAAVDQALGGRYRIKSIRRLDK